eukprot:CAMPEP_0176071808 /NCGR_PEP_ID=MMETSP0120_2-20121206/35868_1 /TAXON_ID=160619 /ORGANISM="Kryptoperidinium foliaceum, Strain CCMP 1326" /LENGTH=122 /DNA_ID=CAMNT_0017405469 /DNA_START=96 /DNA_END=465 /DNA_ORIENTATION=+
MTAVASMRIPRGAKPVVEALKCNGSENPDLLSVNKQPLQQPGAGRGPCARPTLPTARHLANTNTSAEHADDQEMRVRAENCEHIASHRCAHPQRDVRETPAPVADDQVTRAPGPVRLGNVCA